MSLQIFQQIFYLPVNWTNSSVFFLLSLTWFLKNVENRIICQRQRIKKFMRLIMFQFSFEKIESLRVSKSTSVFLTFFTKFLSMCDTKPSLFTLSK